MLAFDRRAAPLCCKFEHGRTMGDFLSQHASAIGSFIAGLLTGGVTGSLITLRITGRNQVLRGGSITDQSRSVAGGDIVGGNKTSNGKRS